MIVCWIGLLPDLICPNLISGRSNTIFAGGLVKRRKYDEKFYISFLTGT